MSSLIRVGSHIGVPQQHQHTIGPHPGGADGLRRKEGPSGAKLRGVGKRHSVAIAPFTVRLAPKLRSRPAPRREGARSLQAARRARTRQVTRRTRHGTRARRGARHGAREAKAVAARPPPHPSPERSAPLQRGVSRRLAPAPARPARCNCTPRVACRPQPATPRLSLPLPPSRC